MCLEDPIAQMLCEMTWGRSYSDSFPYRALMAFEVFQPQEAILALTRAFDVKTLWQYLLRKKLSANFLHNCNFGVFGLGDSSYPRFNFPAKKLHKRLQQLGANPLIERGDGDDQHPMGLDGGLEPWLKRLWERVLELRPLAPGVSPVDSNVLPNPSYFFSYVDSTSPIHPVMAQKCGAEVSATVVRNDRVTQEDHFQDVRHVILDIQSSGLSYRPGDIVNFRPKNLPTEVTEAIRYFGWESIADKPFEICCEEGTGKRHDTRKHM
ncbi:NADPH-dependent diflavin oxidoreductase 1 [Gonapodya sp. JEL0774]|nr:NADPH-dependent diflavin oxidoreductase 1 [Gonapodya sp. JEL0774]